MNDIDLKTIEKIAQNFKNKRVLVLGDIMLDRYIWGNVARISPEAPVPVVEVKKDTSQLGGAANVSHNLESLGAIPLLLGVVGKDRQGEWIKNKVSDSSGILIDANRPTTIKTRIIAHHQQVVRVDQEKKTPIPSYIEEKILQFVREEKYEGILISDYNKGTITKSLMTKLLDYASEKKIPVFVDPKFENFFLYSPVTLITPNNLDAEKIVLHECRTDYQVENACQKILSKISSAYIILKRGEQGMTVFEKGKKAIHIPTQAKEVYDVTGAGDTVLATAALALLAGASIKEAAFLANAAAGVVVGKIGTSVLMIKELLNAVK